jgi:hypothetical protein
MKHPLARILVPFVAVIALRPAAAEKITQKHPDYPVLRLVETRHSAVSQLEESCRQAEKMREAMQLVADLGTPLLPVIDGLASGSLLKSVGKLPGAEGPVEVIESTAGALEVVLGFVAWMNNLGDEYQAPIRGAILASNRLLKSRDSRDVLALLSSYRSACEACVRIEERLSTAQTQLAKAIRLVNLSVVVFDRLGQNSDEIRRSVRELSGQLEKLREIVDLMAGQAEGGHRFMQQVLDAAGPSQAITSGSARVRSTPADHSGSVAAGVAGNFSPETEESSSDSRTRPTELPSSVGTTPNPIQPSGDQIVPPSAVPGAQRYAAVQARDVEPSSRRGGHSGPILVASALPGIAALPAILWMLYSHYVLAPRRRMSSCCAPFEAGSVARAAILRIGARQVVILPDQSALIGSDASRNSVHIDDPTVAPVHARIEFVGEHWWITNLSSISGTYLDGRPVVQEALSDGQRLCFGSVEMLFTARAGSGPR